MNIKVIKRRAQEYISDFVQEMYSMTLGRLRNRQATKIGEQVALPKKYYSKALNDKEILNLGIPCCLTKDGNTIYVKPYQYKFQGRERTTNVITTLGRDKNIVKSVVQTQGIPFCYRLEGNKPLAYRVTHVFDSKGNKINHICQSMERFEGSQEMLRKFCSTTDDGLMLRTKMYNLGCDSDGEQGRRFMVNFGPTNSNKINVKIFSGEDKFKNAKEFIESVRVENNSPRSRYARTHTLMPPSKNRVVIIN